MSHQPEFAAACTGPSADRAVIDGAIALAWTAIDAATRPELRHRLLTPSPAQSAGSPQSPGGPAGGLDHPVARMVNAPVMPFWAWPGTGHR